MAHVVAGLFKNSYNAGQAVAELKEAGFTDKVSVISKDWEDTEVKTETVKDDDKGVAGAVMGAVVGGLAGLIAGASSVLLPGLGTVLVAGPLTGLLGAAGALTGGLIGFLVDLGIPEEQAKQYEEAVRRGEVLITVFCEHEDEDDVLAVLDTHEVYQTEIQHDFKG